MSRLLLCLALILSAAQIGCGSGDDGHHLPPPGDGDADSDADADTDGDADGDSQCIVDDDGDGYGVGIGGGCLGTDCDDNDPSAWDDCSSCPEGIARKTCPCFGTEDPVECHSSDLYEDTHGRLRCKVGQMFCEDGEEPETFTWGLCQFPDGTSE